MKLSPEACSAYAEAMMEAAEILDENGLSGGKSRAECLNRMQQAHALLRKNFPAWHKRDSEGDWYKSTRNPDSWYQGPQY